MTKMFKKTKCEFVENKIMHKSNQLAVSNYVFDMLEELEDNLQRARYILSQPQMVPAPSMDGFKRDHVTSLPMLNKPATPAHDAKVAEAMALMDEIDSMDVAERINGTIVNMSELVKWCDSKWVTDAPNGTTRDFDLKMIGNPLELRGCDILRFLMEIESADRWAAGNGEVTASFEEE